MKKNTLFLSAFLSVFLFTQVSQAEFSDISSSHENLEAINYMKEKGIVKGYSDGSFKPENKINRAEFLKITIEGQEDFSLSDAEECLNNQASNFVYLSDVKKSDWFAPYVCHAIEQKIIQGYPDGTFQANNEINFPEMAKIISNTQGLSIKASKSGDDWFKPFITALENNKAIPSSITNFQHKVTRAEMAESLFRIKENRTDKTTRTFEELLSSADFQILHESGNMGEVESCNMLASLMKQSSEYSPNIFMKMRNFGAIDEVEENFVTDSLDAFSELSDEASIETSALESPSSKSSADDFSTTNIQVSGVDEADIIKNDGKYIYLIKDDTVRIVEAYPSSNMKQVANFTVDDESFYPADLFLNDNQLIIIGNSWREEKQDSFKSIAPDIWYPRYWGTNLTKVYIVDITDRSKPIIERSLAYEANYSKSRRIGDVLYMVMNKNPDYHILRELERDAEEIIPFVSDSAKDDGEEKPACGCDDIHYFPGYEQPNYLMLSAIPLDNPKEKVSTEVMLGASDNIYMSKKSLYVATGVADVEKGVWSYDNTQIYKFDINGLNIKFKASEDVPGRILNQFSMDEFREDFRIATTKDQNWRTDELSSNRLYILDKNLKQTGAIEDIAPGERIYSVRFMGKKAIMVTFKNVDPLFVIDLSHSHDPQILGQLKIPGWSNYLHPYDENHIIGFGKDVIAPKNEDDPLTGNAIQGFKMSIFDISDVENPKEMFKEIIGDRGTNSELLNNHKALLFDKSKNLLAFPITITEKKDAPKNCGTFRYSSCPGHCVKRCMPSSCADSGICTSDCEGVGSCQINTYDQIQTIFSGAVVYDIDLENGFNKRGDLSHYEDDSYFEKSGEWFYGNDELNIDRILYIGENLYTVSPGVVKAADIKTVDEKNKTTLK